jgi:hypothetical protein
MTSHPWRLRHYNLLVQSNVTSQVDLLLRVVELNSQAIFHSQEPTCFHAYD